MTSEEHILDEIENLLEFENMLYAENETNNKTSVDWRDRTRGSSFKKNLTAAAAAEDILSDEEEEEPFDVVVVKHESVEECDVSVGEVDTSTSSHDEEAPPPPAVFWVRHSSVSIDTSVVDVMNKVLMEEGMNPFDLEEEETNDEIANIIHQVDAEEEEDAGEEPITSSSTLEAEPQPPTEEQQFVMNVLLAGSAEQVASPLQKRVSFEPTTTSSPSHTDNLENAVDALVIGTHTSSMSPTKEVLMMQEIVTTPQKNEDNHLVLAIDPTPVTPTSQEEVDFMVDPTYAIDSEDDEEDSHRMVRIQISDEDDSYDGEQPFDEQKNMMQHPVLMGRHHHDFTLHRTVQVNAVETFEDEHVNDDDCDQAPEAQVINVLSPLRNLLTPRKWKSSPKTPSTVGESPQQNGDIESGMNGDGVIRSDLNRQFAAEDDEEDALDWKRVYCTKKKIYLMCILAFLVIILIAVVSVIVGVAQKDEPTVDRGINDFYKVTPGEESNEGFHYVNGDN